MTQDLFNQFNQNTQKIYEPWSKLNKAFLKNAELMTDFSLSSIKSYSEMGLERLRQYSEIDSPESAKEFSDKQSEIVNTLSQKIIEDSQRLTEIGNEMRNEVSKVISEVYGESTQNMQSAMQETADKATKNATEFTQNMTKMAEQAASEVANATAVATKTKAPAARKTATTAKSK